MTEKKLPQLRGHHLICLQFFSGEGFEPAFIENLTKVISKTTQQSLEIFYGGDDICIICEHYKEGKCVDQNEVVLKMDVKALQLLQYQPGAITTWDDIKKKTPGIFKSWYETFCVQCDWQWVCEKNQDYCALRKKNLRPV